MGFEIEFFQVGTGSKGGDAIIFRYGELLDGGTNYKTIVIDGGTKATGKKIINHIKTYISTKHVDYIFLTHADADHASGLLAIMEEVDISIGNIVMHQPWNYSDLVLDRVLDGRKTEKTVEEHMYKALRYAKDISDLADSRKIPITKGFQEFSTPDGVITILGPTEDFYTQLLLASTDTPLTESSEFAKAQYALQDFIKYSSEQAVEYRIKESMDMSTETLKDPEDFATSERNNSCIILGIKASDKHHIILTGDAGVEGLTYAFTYAESIGFDLKNLYLFQIPHHGSHHNIGPKILEKIKGKNAVVSAPPKWIKHPSRKVLNAFIRRSWAVYSPESKGRFYVKAPERPKMIKWNYHKLFDFVED